jgi:serine/threonine-protein kinase
MEWSSILKSQNLFSDDAVKPPKLSIPPLSVTVSKFMEKSQDEGFSMIDAQKIIELDAGITFELLKFVNSASFGLRSKATSIKQAVSLLGIKKTKLFLISLTTGKMMQNTKSPLLLAKLFSLNALEKGLFARHLGIKLKLDQDLCFASAMLQDFLLPYLTIELLDKYTRFLQILKLPGFELNTLEKEALGWDHALALGQMLHSWKFPNEIIVCVAMHHRIDDILANGQLINSELLPVALSAMLPDLVRDEFVHQSFLEEVLAKTCNTDLRTLGKEIIPSMQELGVNLEGYQCFVERMKN